jgi:hypothetical protein
MSERVLAGIGNAAAEAVGIQMADLWEHDEFAKTVHEAIEHVSIELRHISLKVSQRLAREEYTYIRLPSFST